jgi:hypothetical protein
MHMKNLQCFKYVLYILPLLLLFMSLTSVGAEPLDFFVANQTGGKSLERLAQEYWTWLVTQPSPTIVSKDISQNPDKCLISSDSNNKTIFLYNSYGIDTNFKCTIDSTRSILVPLLVGEWDKTVEEDASKVLTLADSWKSAQNADEDFKNWAVTLDGKTLFKKMGNEQVNSQLKDKILVRNSTEFLIHYPLTKNRYEMGLEDLKSENNTFPAVVDGYYLHLKPIQPGEHKLTYTVLHEPIGGEGVGQVPQRQTWTTTYQFLVK